MNKIIKNIIVGLIILSVMLAGFLCYMGIQKKIVDHCSVDVSSSWCNVILEHETIISETILSTVILFASISFFIINLIYHKNILLKIKRRDVLPFYKLLNLIVKSSIKLALSKGIIHSRIP